MQFIANTRYEFEDTMSIVEQIENIQIPMYDLPDRYPCIVLINDDVKHSLVSTVMQTSIVYLYHNEIVDGNTFIEKLVELNELSAMLGYLEGSLDKKEESRVLETKIMNIESIIL